jgi:hypothetical protein
MANIKIHEFSTGITFQGTPNNWVSTGHTGNYMNSTLSVIPTSVQMDISAGLFNLAEGKSSNTPALIGREVEEGGDAWSVLAVVTRGVDDGGRKNPYYRYFLTQGLNRLPDLINWYIKVAGKPVYDPFDVKQVGHPAIYDDSHTSKMPTLSKFQDLLHQVVIPFDRQCTPLIIHYFSEQQAKNNNQKIAWAYNVEGLEKPEYFQVIYPASAKAQGTIQQQLNQQHTQKQIVGNEYVIKQAITNLINGQNIANQYIHNIVDALNNPNFTTEDWEKSIFDQFNVERQPSNRTYSDLSVRWYFLRGLILPHTLPKFVEWLSHNKLDPRSLTGSYQTFVNFSENIDYHSNQISQRDILRRNMRAGIDYLLVTLLEKPKLIETTYWLLKFSSGAYSREFIYSGYIKQIDEDLQQIVAIKEWAIQTIIHLYLSHQQTSLERDKVELNFKQYLSNCQIDLKSEYFKKASILGRETWQPITQAICEVIWFASQTSFPLKNGNNILFKNGNNILFKNGNNILLKLIFLANFFDKFDLMENSPSSSRIAALFYQLSQGDVPTEVWKRCQFEIKENLLHYQARNMKDRAVLYGLTLKRNISQTETLQKFTWNISTYIFRELGKTRQIKATYLQMLIIAILASLLTAIFKPWPQTWRFFNLPTPQDSIHLNRSP